MIRSRSKEVKQKKCKVCKISYPPRSTTQKVCSPSCAIELNKINREKEFDAETKRLKQAIKSRSDYEAEAQTAINKYIRIRDAKLPCISCGNYHNGQYHAGHYISVAAGGNSLRYNTFNINKQCAPCNNHLSANIVNYRPRLKAKYGKEILAWIEGPHETRKYSIDQLVRLRKVFNKKSKWLKKRQSNIL